MFELTTAGWIPFAPPKTKRPGRPGKFQRLGRKLTGHYIRVHRLLAGDMKQLHRLA